MPNHTIWSKRVHDWRKSGLTAEQFCQGQEYSVGSLRAWSSRLGRASPSAVPAVALARVVRTSSPAHIGRLRVELADVTLDLPADTEPHFVAALAEAMLRRTPSTP